MLLAQIAIYIFMLVFILYMAYRALWIVFFLFNFRFWQIIFENFASGFFNGLSPGQQIGMLIVISLVSYFIIFFMTMRMPLIRYILLAVLFICAIKYYSLADVLFFKDYLEENGMWSMDYWINQVKSLFQFKEGDIVSMVNGILDGIINFFKKIIDAVKGL